MQRSIWQPFWEFVANCAIGIIVLLGMGLVAYLIMRAYADVDLSGALSFILVAILVTGGALFSTFANMHSSIARFIDSVMIRIAQNIALSLGPQMQQSNLAGYLSIMCKAMCGLGLIAFVVTVTSFVLKYYSGGNDPVLNANLDLTIGFAVKGLLISFPFMALGSIYLGKIKPVLPPPVKVQTIGGQQGSLGGATVNVSNAQQPPRNP